MTRSSRNIRSLTGLLNSTAGALALLVTASSSLAADLTVTVTGVKPGEGSLLMVVYDSAAAMQGKGDALARRIRAATSAELVETFQALPDGNYAVMVFQDINSDFTLGKNLVGIPTEPYGFSGPRLQGPPRFENIAIAVDGEENAIVIELNQP